MGNTGNRVCSCRGACCVSVLRRASLKRDLRSLRSCQGLPELAGLIVEKGGGGRAKGPAVETGATILDLYNTSTDGRRGELGGRLCPALDGSRHRIYYYRVVAPAHAVPSPGVISNVARYDLTPAKRTRTPRTYHTPGTGGRTPGVGAVASGTAVDVQGGLHPYNTSHKRPTPNNPVLKPPYELLGRQDVP